MLSPVSNWTPSVVRVTEAVHLQVHIDWSRNRTTKLSTKTFLGICHRCSRLLLLENTDQPFFLKLLALHCTASVKIIEKSHIQSGPGVVVTPTSLYFLRSCISKELGSILVPAAHVGSEYSLLHKNKLLQFQKIHI